jgi:hypothetical protein
LGTALGVGRAGVVKVLAGEDSAAGPVGRDDGDSAPGEVREVVEVEEGGAGKGVWAWGLAPGYLL